MFLSLYGGQLAGDIHMNSHEISGVCTPEIPKDSHVVSVGYLNDQLRSIRDHLDEIDTQVIGKVSRLDKDPLQNMLSKDLSLPRDWARAGQERTLFSFIKKLVAFGNSF